MKLEVFNEENININHDDNAHNRHGKTVRAIYF